MASFGKKSTPEGKRKMQILLDEKSSKSTIPRIWKINPSFKHINRTMTIARTIFFVILVVFFMNSAYFTTFDLSMVLGVGIIISSMFIFVFRDQLYFVRNFASLSFKKAKRIYPFQDLIFLLDSETTSTIYMCNKKELVNTGLDIFRIKVIPENIHASMGLFIKALSEYKNMVNFTFQIIQIPLIHNNQNNQTDLAESVQTFIYFCVHCSVRGTLSLTKVKLLKDKMIRARSVLESNFVGNFHHFQITHLIGLDLVNALRSFFLKIPKDVGFEEVVKRKATVTPNLLIKALFCSILFISSTILLLNLEFSLIYSLFISIVLIGVLIYLWWRELLFLIMNNSIIKSTYFTPINPFNDIAFFRYRGISDSIFAYIDNKLLVGIKMFNLALIRPPSYFRVDKFFQGIMNQKVSFGYTCINSPISFEIFYRKYLDYLNLKTFRTLLFSNWRV